MALKLRSRSGQWESSSEPPAGYPYVQLLYHKFSRGWKVAGILSIGPETILRIPDPLPGYPFTTRAKAQAAVYAWATEQGILDLIPGKFTQGSYAPCKDLPYTLRRRGAQAWEISDFKLSENEEFEAMFDGVIFPTRKAALAALESWLELDTK